MLPTDSTPSIIETKALNNDLGRVYEALYEANDEKENEFSKKHTSDPITDDKISKINKLIDRLEQQSQTKANAIQRSTRGNVNEDVVKHDLSLQHKSAFDSFLRTGNTEGLLSIQTKAMSAGSGVDGGFMVPYRLHDEIIKAVDAKTPFRNLAKNIIISNDNVDLIVDDTLTAAAWVGETAARPETNTSTIQKINIPVHELYAHPKISQRLLDDSAFDLDAWLSEKIAENMGLIEQIAFISGTGTGQPKGILSYTLGTASGQIEAIKTGVSAAFPASNPADVLIRLMFALETRYMPNASWLLNRTLLTDIRTFKDTTGQYIWQPALDGKTNPTLFGYPVALIEQMPIKAASSLSVAFGDIRSAYTVVDRSYISMMRDPFTAKPNVMFYAVKRVGGAVVNTKAIKLLQFAV